MVWPIRASAPPQATYVSLPPTPGTWLARAGAGCTAGFVARLDMVLDPFALTTEVVDFDLGEIAEGVPSSRRGKEALGLAGAS